ncbi:uncharacterized protein DNG_09184 [Cephalotrichum gorgonifer]|uniref:phosphatidylserine decarboxylase n=1 Tax=Cephalotrichum gorgonifer TaxID=2041049 RepID=A0AAE8SZ44_9PEZI|nr:uncharacterized protein DNG_09184 [Cephalotrichum gorgonifer]
MFDDMHEGDAFEIRLDILGQQPLLNKLYTQVTTCFPVPKTISDAHITETLTAGLTRLVSSFPWVGGQVLHTPPTSSCACNFSIVPWRKVPRLILKDLRNDPSTPTMETLGETRFPMASLDESILSPCKTLSAAADMTPFVFAVQATFIKGGLLLTFVGQHNAMDMVGQAELIRLLSKACRGESFTPEEVSNGNMPRHDIVPFLDDSYQPGPELDTQKAKSPAPGSPLAPPECTWEYFGFSADSLATLKAVASESVTTLPGYVSTDDALCALIWQCVTRARLPRLPPAATSTFARAVDVRRAMGVSEVYPGILQNMAYNTLPAADAVSQPLGVIASQLRTSLDPSQLDHRTRVLATALHRLSDKSTMSFTAGANPSTDISFSSWAKIDLYNMDFGLGLGKPAAVRRPRFDMVESLMYIMPRRPDGELVVAMCLRLEDMARLKVDKTFTNIRGVRGVLGVLKPTAMDLIKFLLLLLHRALDYLISWAYLAQNLPVPWVFFDRKTGEIKREDQPLLRKLALVLIFNPLTEWIDSTHVMRLQAYRKALSKGREENTPDIRKRIQSFVEAYSIKMEDFEPSDIDEYATFSEFVTRRISPDSRPIHSPDDPSTAVVPADSRAVVYSTLPEARRLWAKGNDFSLPYLLMDTQLARTFADGSVASFQLSPQGYHRYHSPVNGVVKRYRSMPGDSYPIDPVALHSGVDILTRNRRAYVVIKSDEFGYVLFAAIGGEEVGFPQIHDQWQKPGSYIEKGDELGMFHLGSPSIVMVFQRGMLQFDQDLLDSSKRQIEVAVDMGMSLGRGAGSGVETK